MPDKNRPLTPRHETPKSGAQRTPLKSAMKSLSCVVTPLRSKAHSLSSAGSVGGGGGCNCPNCAAAGYCNLQTMVLLLALPCIIHFYYYLYDSARNPGMSDMQKLFIALGFLGLLVLVQLFLSLFAVPSNDERREWEEKAKEYGYMLLMGGTLFGFLLSVYVVRNFVVGNECYFCGKARW